jgi:hypothetical protein
MEPVAVSADGKLQWFMPELRVNWAVFPLMDMNKYASSASEEEKPSPPAPKYQARTPFCIHPTSIAQTAGTSELSTSDSSKQKNKTFFMFHPSCGRRDVKPALVFKIE